MENKISWAFDELYLNRDCLNVYGRTDRAAYEHAVMLLAKKFSAV